MDSASRSLLRGRDFEHLPRLDLVRVGQLIAIGFEDGHVVRGVAEMFLGNLAEGISLLDGIGRQRSRRGGRGRDLDFTNDVVAPVRYCLDGIPDPVRFVLVLYGALEMQLPVTFFGRAFHTKALCRLNRVVVLIAKGHDSPPAATLSHRYRALKLGRTKMVAARTQQ